MVSFVAAADPNNTSDQTVGNTDFYPAITVAAFRAATRAQDSITDQRIIEALRSAIIGMNGELSAWQAEQEALGYFTLDAVPADLYDTISELTHHYLTAVYSRAKAQILEYYRDADNSDAGEDRADELDNTRDAYLSDARRSIRKILGEPQMTVELI